MSKLIISEIERNHIASLHNLLLFEQTIEKVKVFKDKGGTYQYAKLPNGTYWYKAGEGKWTPQTNQKGMDAIEKRITSPNLVDAQPDLEVTSIDTEYKVEVKDDGNDESESSTATTATTTTTTSTSSEDENEAGEDEKEAGEDEKEGGENEKEGGENENEDKSISATRGEEDEPKPQFNTSMVEKYPKNPLAKYSGYFKTIKII